MFIFSRLQGIQNIKEEIEYTLKQKKIGKFLQQISKHGKYYIHT